MTNKFLILLIIFTLGFFSRATLSYACAPKSAIAAKSCCKKNNSSKKDKKDCCKNHKSKNQKSGDGCEQKCNQKSCCCPSPQFSHALSFSTEIETKTCFVESNKPKWYHKDNYLSSGYYSVWTPPNIS